MSQVQDMADIADMAVHFLVTGSANVDMPDAARGYPNVWRYDGGGSSEILCRSLEWSRNAYCNVLSS